MPFDSTWFAPNLSVRDQRALRVIAKMRTVLGDPDHWIQHSFQEQGNFCLIGALRHVTLDWSLRERVTANLYAALPTDPRPHRLIVDAVIYFNDNCDTDHSDVIDLLDHARTIILEKRGSHAV